MVYFLLGVIIGILVRDIKYFTITKVDKIKESLKREEETKFFEPVTPEERWYKAENLTDVIQK